MNEHEIKFKLVGRNKSLNVIHISKQLTIDDIFIQCYPSFFKQTNRDETTGNCEFIAEILCTNVKDMNNNEIYEGHIIVKKKNMTNDFIGVVVYCKQMCRYIIEGKNTTRYMNLSDSAQYGDEYGIVMSSLEIIGNVFENPELLT